MFIRLATAVSVNLRGYDDLATTSYHSVRQTSVFRIGPRGMEARERVLLPPVRQVLRE